MTNHKEISERLTMKELLIYANEYRNRLRYKNNIKKYMGLSDNKGKMSDKQELKKDMSDINKEVSDKLSDNKHNTETTKQKKELNIFK